MLKKTQQGATLISVLMVIFIVLLIGWSALKLAPVYIQHYSVVKIMDKIKSKYEAKLQHDSFVSTHEIQGTLYKHMDVNYINHLTKKNISVDRTPKGFKVRIKYDVNVPFIANIDALLHFDNTVKIELKGGSVSTSATPIKQSKNKSRKAEESTRTKG